MAVQAGSGYQAWLAAQPMAGPQGPAGWQNANYNPPDEVPPQTGDVGWDRGTGQFTGGQGPAGPQGPYVPSTNPFANGKTADGYVIGTNPKPMFGPGPNGQAAAGYQDNGPGTPTTPIYPGAGGPAPSQHPVLDAYGNELQSNIAGANSSYAAEAAAINAHYDAAQNSLHQNYQSSVTGVNAEGQRAQGELAGLATDLTHTNAAANAKVAAASQGAINMTQKGATHDAGYLKGLGVSKGDAASYTSAIHDTIATERANGANDQAYSVRLGQLAQATINDRRATETLLTSASLDDLRTLLTKGMANIDMARADAASKANIERIKTVAAAKANYAQEVAARIAYVEKQRTAAGAKPLTFSEKSQIATHTNPPNYSGDFKPLFASKDPQLAQWASDSLDSMVGTGGNPPRNPVQMYQQFTQAGSKIPGFSDAQNQAAAQALDAARRQYISTSRNNAAWLAAHGYK